MCLSGPTSTGESAVRVKDLGPILPLIMETPDLAQVMHERHLRIDATATGRKCFAFGYWQRKAAWQKKIWAAVSAAAQINEIDRVPVATIAAPGTQQLLGLLTRLFQCLVGFDSEVFQDRHVVTAFDDFSQSRASQTANVLVSSN